MLDWTVLFFFASISELIFYKISIKLLDSSAASVESPVDDKMHSAFSRPENMFWINSIVIWPYIILRKKGGNPGEKCFMIMKILVLWDQNVFRLRIFHNNAFSFSFWKLLAANECFEFFDGHKHRAGAYSHVDRNSLQC